MWADYYTSNTTFGNIVDIPKNVVYQKRQLIYTFNSMKQTPQMFLRSVACIFI